MIDEVKELLKQRNLTKAAIIDDAYDEAPSPDEITSNRWSRFFDDLTEGDENFIRGVHSSYDSDEASDLQKSVAFVSVLWDRRAELRNEIATDLFEDFIREQTEKRQSLTELETVLGTDLGLSCVKAGRSYATAAQNAEIVFVDLFLGPLDDDTAMERAVARVKEIVTDRVSPPLIVLMSSSSRLPDCAARFRDEAHLLGCLFRTAKKADLVDKGVVLEQIYALAVAYKDALRLSGFLGAWKAALESAKNTLLELMRKLDLSDYANIHQLVLEAEGNPLGDYMLDLYDTYLHYILEGDQSLILAAKELNSIDWEEYPPPHFGPSPEAIRILDGTTFENETRTKSKPEDVTLHLGDVLFAKNAKAAENSDGESPTNPAPGALVVLTQACDLLQGNAQSVLFVPGSIHPYTSKFHKKPEGSRTPVLRVGDKQYVVDWDVGSPVAWPVKETGNRIGTTGEYDIVRRFRTLYALKMQQLFTGNLGRVGTPAPVPARYPVQLKIFFRNASGEAALLLETTAEEDKAVCLFGRDAENRTLSRLVLVPECLREFRIKLMALDTANIYESARSQIDAARRNFKFYRHFMKGVQFAPKENTRSLKGTPFDVVQVVTTAPLEEGQPMKNVAPLAFQIIDPDLTA